MRTVTLYSSKKKSVVAHSGYIPFCSLRDVIRIGDEFIDNRQANIDVEYLEVRRFCFNTHNETKDVFVAFEPELQQLIDVLVNEACARKQLTNSLLAQDNQKLIAELNDWKSKSIFWIVKERIKGIFK